MIIPLWGALVGFSLGAGAVAAWTDEGFLAKGSPGWSASVALVFASAAYLFCEVAVVTARGRSGSRSERA